MMLRPLTPEFHRRRRQCLRRRLEAEDLDGILVLNTANVVYLSGFFHAANERPIGLYQPRAGEPRLYVPLLEKENAEIGLIAEVRTYPEFPGIENPILFMIRDSGARRLAFDTIPDRLMKPASERLKALAISDMVAEQRFAKEPEELDLIRAAAGYADLCLETISAEAASLARAGATEIDILRVGMKAARHALMSDHGAALGHTKLGITGTLHTGPRGALPHGRTSERRPRTGDTMIVGIGAAVGGYHAESGITLVFGEPNRDQRACLAAMAAANDAAIAALAERKSCDTINELALAQIQKAGFGAFIRHRIGHGMGIEGHEAPWLAPGDSTPTCPGMVFSNEPGIYRPGVDGYRTINTMILTETGVDVPSRFQATRPLEARVVPL